MFGSKLLCTAAFALTLVAAADAQRAGPASIPQPATPTVTYTIQNPDVAALALAANWVSAVFDFPEVQTLPNIRRLPNSAAEKAQHGNFISYDDATRTIYLPARWSGTTPAEMSVLVHALVRHFQNIGKPRSYDCPEQRNAQAYDAQERWLNLYDTSLHQELGIEPATLMLLTQCIP